MLNFHALTKFQMIKYLLWDRWFMNPYDRIFFEGELFLMGQLYLEERKLLYETIRDYKPFNCYEIGTYTGGGSTYFISKALYDNGNGLLITLESDLYYHNKAKNYYRRNLPNFCTHVLFFLGSSPSLFDRLVISPLRRKLVFLDGGNDATETVTQYNHFTWHEGDLLALHDWNTIKMENLKTILLQNPHWKLEKIIGEPISVGMALFVYEN